jgi:hypothetical protein
LQVGGQATARFGELVPAIAAQSVQHGGGYAVGVEGLGGEFAGQHGLDAAQQGGHGAAGGPRFGGDVRRDLLQLGDHVVENGEHLLLQKSRGEADVVLQDVDEGGDLLAQLLDGQALGGLGQRTRHLGQRRDGLVQPVDLGQGGDKRVDVGEGRLEPVAQAIQHRLKVAADVGQQPVAHALQSRLEGEDDGLSLGRIEGQAQRDADQVVDQRPVGGNARRTLDSLRL